MNHLAPEEQRERDLFNEVVRQYNASHPDCLVKVLYKENEELRNSTSSPPSPARDPT